MKRKRKNEGGLDPEDAQQRFEAIRAQLKKTDASIARYGRTGNASVKNLEDLAELFKYLKADAPSV